MSTNTPTRFPKGVTNVDASDQFRTLPVLDPTQVSVFHEDFHYYWPARWTVTDTGTDTQAAGSEEFGVLDVTLGAVAADASYLQKESESFSLETGRRAWFKARFSLSDATDADAIMGMQITDTTPLAVSDGVWFQTDNGDANLDFHCAKGSTQQDKTAIATLADSTYVVVAFYWNGVDRIEAYVDGVIKAVITDISTYMPTHTLTVSFGHKTTAGTANVMKVDYVFTAEERV